MPTSEAGNSPFTDRLQHVTVNSWNLEMASRIEMLGVGTSVPTGTPPTPLYAFKVPQKPGKVKAGALPNLAQPLSRLWCAMKSLYRRLSPPRWG